MMRRRHTLSFFCRVGKNRQKIKRQIDSYVQSYDKYIKMGCKGYVNVLYLKHRDWKRYRYRYRQRFRNRCKSFV